MSEKKNLLPGEGQGKGNHGVDRLNSSSPCKDIKVSGSPNPEPHVINMTGIITDADCEAIAAIFSMAPSIVRRHFLGERCWVMVRNTRKIHTPAAKKSEQERRRKRIKSKIVSEVRP